MIPPTGFGHPVRDDQPAEIINLGDDLIVMIGFTTITAACIDCETVVATIAEAQAHARDARHRVECDRRSAFTFAPAELFDGVR
jgi:hypothetical protein